MHGRFLWDDPVEITGNPELRDLRGLGKIWFSPADPDYYPLKTTVQWAEWHLWGARVEGYHVVSVALHVLSALLLWRLLRQLGVTQAWLGGLIFAVHPLTVESVAWISELKNTLSLPFVLLALIGWSDSENSKFGIRNSKYFLSLLYFLAALLCKSSVVMFPFVLLLYSWWKRGRVGRADIIASAPFFLLSLLFGCVTLWFQSHRAIGVDVMRMPGLASRAADAGPAVWFYLFKGVIPFHPLPVYPSWHFGARSPVSWLAWAALAAALGWIWSLRAGWGRHVLFGFGFFLINLVPVLGFVPMYYLHIARVGDQFVYLPLVGLAGLAAAAIGKVDAASRRVSTRNAARYRVYLLSAIVSAIVLALAISSHLYAGVFASDESLWTYTLRFNPGAWLAQNNLAGLRFAENRLDEALAAYEQALRIRPGYPEADIGMGNCLERGGRPDLAIPWYRRALRIIPNSPEAHNNLGYALERVGRLPEAITQFDLAISARADLPLAYYNRANALSAAGRLPDAILSYQKALQLKPDFPEARHNLDLARRMAGLP